MTATRGETITQPRDQAHQTARALLGRWPPVAYRSQLESWRELPGDEIEFTMKRLRNADSYKENPRSSGTRTELSLKVEMTVISLAYRRWADITPFGNFSGLTV